MAYLWLTTKSRKQIMKDNGLYSGAVDSIRDAAYLDGIEKVNKKYLPARFQKRVYYKETDIVLRNLRRLKEAGAKNFNLEEFKCGCGRRYCSGYPVVLNKQLLINLQKVRDKFGPVTITPSGGMRCETWNAKTPGSIKNSRHITGKAVDICIAGLTDTLAGRQKVMAYWKTLPNYGYTYCDVNGSNPNMGNAVHVDVK